MSRLLLWILPLLLTISTTITSEAKTYDPSVVLECTADCVALDWKKVKIIDDSTLRVMYSDAKGYKASLENLVDAQQELNDTTKKLNKALTRTTAAEQQLREVEHPPWYKNPQLWGIAGLALGVVATSAIYIAASK